MPQVSVIIPTHDQRPDYLRAAVESALSQSYANTEVIVIDDGSTQHPAGAALGSLVERVRLVEKPNGGPASARNTGVKEARGDFIAFLDSDDLWKPNKLTRHMEAHERHPEWALTFSQSSLLRGGTVTRIKPRHAPSGMIFLPLVRRSYITTCSVVVVRRDAFDLVGFFNERLDAAEDYEFYFRLAQRAPFGFIRRPLTYFRTHGANASRNAEAIHGAKVDIFEALVDLAHDNNDSALDRAARRKLAYHLVKLAQMKTRQGEDDTASAAIKRALDVCPWSGKAWRAYGLDWASRLLPGNGSV